MSFLKLGTRCAVINDMGEILLSKRGDFGNWDLPGGRLDAHELLPAAAAREVREETGLEVEIVRTVGQYFAQGRDRMNVLYRVRPVGGELLQRTDETLDNRFFAPDALPEDTFGVFRVQHAYSDQTMLHIIETPPEKLREIEKKLKQRWLENLKAGRPEPEWVRYSTWAVGMVRDAAHERVFTTRDTLTQQAQALPRVALSGKDAPHVELSQRLQTHLNADFRWVGMWQDVATNTIEFIYEATAEADDSPRWQTPDAVQGARNRAYLAQQTQSDDIWLIEG